MEKKEESLNEIMNQGGQLGLDLQKLIVLFIGDEGNHVNFLKSIIAKGLLAREIYNICRTMEEIAKSKGVSK